MFLFYNLTLCSVYTEYYSMEHSHCGHYNVLLYMYIAISIIARRSVLLTLPGLYLYYDFCTLADGMETFCVRTCCEVTLG